MLRRRQTWAGSLALLCAGCGMIGIEVQEDSQAITIGDGDDFIAGDGDAPGDGDESGDGDMSASGGAGMGLGGTSGEPKNTGGTFATGGTVSTGGATSTGGAMASGGTPPSGGTNMGSGGTDPGTGGVVHMPDLLLWEEFEGDALPSTPVREANGNMELVEDIVHSGDVSLLAEQGVETDGRVEISEDIDPQFPGDVLYTRVWAYIPSATINGRIDFYRLGNHDEGSLDFGATSEGRLVVHFNGEGQTSSSPTGRFPFDEWVCLETTTELHDESGSLQLALNGTTVLTMPSRNTAPGGSLEYFSYGILNVRDGQTGGQVYFDDLAVDTAPIGCE